MGESLRAYAGDFRDGIACVRQNDGLCIHIDPDGRTVHPGAYLDLDVFHKGFARARDERGWLHVRRDGNPAYDARFAEVEPFYNGQALCRDWAGRRIIVNESGGLVAVVFEANRITSHQGLPATGPMIVIVGNCGAGKSTLALSLAQNSGLTWLSIDNFRRTASDGSPAGEIRAWQQFLEAIQQRRSGGAVVEFSGSGQLAHLVKLALDEIGDYFVIWLRTSIESSLTRTTNLVVNVPYPRFGVSVKQLIPELHARLEREFSNGTIWPSERVYRVDANGSPTEVLHEVTKLLTKRGRM